MYSKWCRVWLPPIRFLVSQMKKDIRKISQKLTSEIQLSNPFTTMNNEWLIPIIAEWHFVLIVLSYFIPNPMETPIYGIPNALLLEFWWQIFLAIYSHLSIHDVLYNVFVFEDQNQCIEWKSIRNEEKKTIFKIQTIFETFHWLFFEINEYNTTFCSKILLSFWITHGITTIIFIYISIFVWMKITLKVVIGYFTIIFSILFLFIIFTASSVSNSVFKSFKTLNSLFISYTKHTKHPLISCVKTKIKVNLIKIEIMILINWIN